MEGQSLFPGKNKKNINLLSAEYAYKVVKVKESESLKLAQHIFMIMKLKFSNTRIILRKQDF